MAMQEILDAVQMRGSNAVEVAAESWALSLGFPSLQRLVFDRGYGMARQLRELTILGSRAVPLLYSRCVTGALDVIKRQLSRFR